MNLENHKKDAKKSSLLVNYSNNELESGSDVDENIICTTVHKEVDLISLHPKEEKEMTKIFHIKI